MNENSLPYVEAKRLSIHQDVLGKIINKCFTTFSSETITLSKPGVSSHFINSHELLYSEQYSSKFNEILTNQTCHVIENIQQFSSEKLFSDTFDICKYTTKGSALIKWFHATLSGDSFPVIPAEQFIEHFLTRNGLLWSEI